MKCRNSFMFVYWEFVKLFPISDWLVSQYWYQCVCTIDLADTVSNFEQTKFLKVKLLVSSNYVWVNPKIGCNNSAWEVKRFWNKLCNNLYWSRFCIQLKTTRHEQIIHVLPHFQRRDTTKQFTVSVPAYKILLE